MESLLNRYRNITILLLVIMAQLVLLAVDAKTSAGVPLIRVWAVTTVTPVARLIEGVRGGGSGFLQNYILLHDTNAENRRLKAEVDRLKMENIALKNDLNTADRAKALQLFQAHTASRTVAATVIATGAGANSRVVYADRGSASGIVRGMGVVTPDGVVGKVIAAYPTASEILLISDPDFAAGVISQKNAVRGTLKGQGTPVCRVEYVPFEEKIEVGEWFYTSGDDRVFPRGFPVGIVRSVLSGQPFKEILVEPSGLQRGLQDVLILVEGVHQEIPEVPPAVQPMYIAPPPPASGGKSPEAAAPAPPGTEADRLRQQYKSLGEAQNHNYGENPPGSKAVDFSQLGSPPAPAAAPVQTPPNTKAPGPQPKPEPSANPNPPSGQEKRVNPPATKAPALQSKPPTTAPVPPANQTLPAPDERRRNPQAPGPSGGRVL